MREKKRKLFLPAVLVLTAVVLAGASREVADSAVTPGGTPAAARHYVQAESEQVFEVQIKGRKVAPDMNTIRVKQGDSVRIRWTTDEATEVHLHGYNIKTRLEPGKAADMRFKARAAGRFAITSHGFGSHSHGHHDEPTLVYVEVLP
jgi:FtsP/CotA-like multicopper oxidase with cupredoxin domain